MHLSIFKPINDAEKLIIPFSVEFPDKSHDFSVLCFQSNILIDDRETGERKEGFGTITIEADTTRMEMKSIIIISSTLTEPLASASFMYGTHLFDFDVPTSVDGTRTPIVEVHSVRPSAIVALLEGTVTVHLRDSGMIHAYAIDFIQSCPTSRSYVTISSDASSAILKTMKREGTNHLRKGDKDSSVRKTS